MMTDRTFHNIDVGGELRDAHGHLVRALERFAAFAAIGDRFTRLPDDVELPGFGSLMRFGVGASDRDRAGPRAEVSDVSDNFAAYCGRFSVIGMVTACEVYLQRMLFIVRLGELAAKSSGYLLGQQFNETKESVRREIRRTSVDLLPINIVTPLNRSESEVPQLPYFRGIYTARKCLLHRGGVVGEDDVDAEGTLTVSWQHVVVRAGDTAIDELPFSVEKGTLLSAEVVERSRQWTAGQAVELTVQDCQEIAMTLAQFGGTLMGVVGEGIKQLITKAKEDEAGRENG